MTARRPSVAPVPFAVAHALLVAQTLLLLALFLVPMRSAIRYGICGAMVLIAVEVMARAVWNLIVASMRMEAK